MSNLIDANELYIRIREQVKSPAIVGCLGGIMAEVPTFGLDDLRPKGRWNVVEFDEVSRRITIECSECGMVEEMTVMAYGFGHNFCHICGADMRGG